MQNVSHIEEHALWTRSGPITAHMSQDQVAALEEQTTATIADPAGLGWWGLATGAWMTGTVYAGFFPTGGLALAVPVLLIFAGLGQFIAGLYEYRRANALAATAFCCFGAFNIAFATMEVLLARQIVPTGANAAIFQGFLLESFGFIALALTFAALRANTALVLALGTLAIGYICSGVPQLAGGAAAGVPYVVGQIGGYFLFAAALLAYYTGMAMVVNSTWQRTVLPLGGQP